MPAHNCRRPPYTRLRGPLCQRGKTGRHGAPGVRRRRVRQRDCGALAAL